MTPTDPPHPASPVAQHPSGAPRAALSLVDTTSIIVGIIIGVGIYETTPNVASNTQNLAVLMGVWLLGGLLATIGALCYAELATAFPKDGGDYVYLRRAYGPSMGFVFAWAELWVIRPGSIGAVAFVFARYANQLIPCSDSTIAFVVYAAGAVVMLTVINILGVQASKWTQNLLTAAKIVGLLALTAAALVGPAAVDPPPAPLAVDASGAANLPRPDLNFAMLMVMFTYGGWSDVAFVAAEVRDARKNILRSLLLGIGTVTAIYLLVNLAFVHALGFAGLQNSEAPAADLLKLRLGDAAGHAVSVLICISSLGAINGQIFTGARIYAALGQDHPTLGRLGHWSPRFGTPTGSLVLQGAVALIPMIGFGLQDNAFKRLVVFTTPVFWFFLLLVGIGLIILRQTAASVPRPYRVFGYPWTPLLFSASSLMMLYFTFAHALKPENRSAEAFWAVGLLAVGYVLSFFSRPTAQSPR